MSNPSDLAAEYGNIKAYCRKEAAKSFKDPRAPEPVEPAATEGDAPADLNDDELSALLDEG